jgi:hypothetical protein
VPPLPPPVEVIVENTELEPLVAVGPPAPTVTVNPTPDETAKLDAVL